MAVFQLIAAVLRLFLVAVASPFRSVAQTRPNKPGPARVPTRRVLGGWMYTPRDNDVLSSSDPRLDSEIEPALEASLCDLEVLDRELFEAYSLLGVPVDASPEEIDQAFKARLAGNSKRVTRGAGTVVEEISARRVKQLRNSYEKIRRFQGR
jgi:hypothetical protein